MHDKSKGPAFAFDQRCYVGLPQPGPGPQGVLKVEPFLQYKAEDEATPLQPPTKEEEEEQEEEEIVEVVEVLNFKDNFEVFN